MSARGFCMGAADVVPGVSGGTMAFILGIYEELVKAIRSFDMDFIKLLLSLRIKDAFERVSYKFLLSLGIGILVAIFSLARILTWLLENQPVMIWSFFLGLILASTFIVSRYLEHWGLSVFICMMAGIVASYVLVGTVPVSTPESPWFLVLSGAVAICAMILPGISGSYILVLFGKYYYVLEAVNKRDFFTLFLVAAGACFGLLAFSRLLNWLLHRHHDLTIAVLAGLMLGSLRKIWPWKEAVKTAYDVNGEKIMLPPANMFPSHLDNELFMALFLMALGFIIVFALGYYSKNNNG
ncbi:MAG: DUF368 domain-containing protein [Deltaproteobacteria bacterium]|nr:DUF368 domain-containing protein [Deltaproteobacteria bacterium]